MSIKMNFLNFNPKHSIYNNDGTGRDKYISTNNGGFSKVSYNTNKIILKSQNYCASKNSVRNIAPIKYRGDGSGRDYYIILDGLTDVSLSNISKINSDDPNTNNFNNNNSCLGYKEKYLNKSSILIKNRIGRMSVDSTKRLHYNKRNYSSINCNINNNSNSQDNIINKNVVYNNNPNKNNSLLNYRNYIPVSNSNNNNNKIKSTFNFFPNNNYHNKKTSKKNSFRKVNNNNVPNNVYNTINKNPRNNSNILNNGLFTTRINNTTNTNTNKQDKYMQEWNKQINSSIIITSKKKYNAESSICITNNNCIINNSNNNNISNILQQQNKRNFSQNTATNLNNKINNHVNKSNNNQNTIIINTNTNKRNIKSAANFLYRGNIVKLNNISNNTSKLKPVIIKQDHLNLNCQVFKIGNEINTNNRSITPSYQTLQKQCLEERLTDRNFFKSNLKI